jgi:hypothetical protein
MSGDTRDTLPVGETKKLTVEDVVDEIERRLEPGHMFTANFDSVRAQFKLLLEWIDMRRGR